MEDIWEKFNIYSQALCAHNCNSRSGCKLQCGCKRAWECLSKTAGCVKERLTTPYWCRLWYADYAYARGLERQRKYDPHCLIDNIWGPPKGKVSFSRTVQTSDQLTTQLLSSQVQLYSTLNLKCVISVPLASLYAFTKIK